MENLKEPTKSELYKVFKSIQEVAKRAGEPYGTVSIEGISVRIYTDSRIGDICAIYFLKKIVNQASNKNEQ